MKCTVIPGLLFIYPYYYDYVIADTVFELPVLAMQEGMQAAL